MFTDTKFPREKPLTYKIEAIGGDGKAAPAVSIEVTPETTLKAPPIPPQTSCGGGRCQFAYFQSAGGRPL